MRRLLTSKDRSRVELVRKELFRAGIRCEVRSNTVAQPLLDLPALLELWIKQDADYLRASKLIADLQSSGNPEPAVQAKPADEAKAAPTAPPNDRPEEPAQNQAADPSQVSSAIASEESALTEAEKAAAELLSAQEGIHQQLLDLRDKCAALERQLEKATEALTKSREQLARETARRSALEQQAAEFAGLRTALEQERAERAKVSERMRHELETKTGALQAAEAAVAELRQVRVELTKKVEAVGERERVLLKRVEPLQAELEARSARVQALESSLQAETDERCRVQAHLEASEARLRALTNQLKAIASSHVQPLKPGEKAEASRVAVKI